MKPRIVVIGAGAIGGYVGGKLAMAGHGVTLIDPWPAHVEAIRAHGLQLHGITPAERHSIAVPALHLGDVQHLAKERPVDIAIVSVKSYDTAWATLLMREYLASTGFVVSAQNCINEATIAGVVGWGRTVGCIVAGITAELVEPGHIHRTGPLAPPDVPSLRVGEPHGIASARAERLAQILAVVDSVKLTNNLWGERWSKLCVNAMRNGVSAATGLGGNARDRDDTARWFSIRVGSEAVRIGRALGYQLGKIGRLEPDLLARAGTGDAAARAEAEAILVAGSNSSGRSDLQRPSMAQDMAKGRRTEIDLINGFVAAQGRRVGMNAPATLALAELVHRVERGELPARPENLMGL